MPIPLVRPSRVAPVEILLAIAFCLAGLLLAHYPMIFSGFARVETDRFDTRLNNFILEHGYLWLRGDPHHSSFWSPQVFYPQANTLAYSEILLGVAPFYWVWRAVGFAPDTSFQLWMLTMSILNFVSSYWALRKVAGLETLPASAGAFLFSFAGLRLAHLIRQQLLGQFYFPLMIGCLWLAYSKHRDGGSRARTAAWLFAATVCFLGQLYACFYLGWFLGLGLLVTAFWAMVIAPYRTAMLDFGRRNLPALGTCALFFFALLAPMLMHYIQARYEVPRRHFMDAYESMPTPGAWWYVGRANWLEGWTSRFVRCRTVTMNEPLGVGFVTTLAALLGLWHFRFRPAAQLMMLLGATIVLYAALVSGSVDLVKLQFKLIPGAYAVRACHRVAFLMLIPGSLGLAYAIAYLQSQRAKWLTLALAILCVLEQGRTLNSYDKYRARREDAVLSAKVKPRAEAFFMSPVRGQTDRFNIDAMWVYVATGIPTINGHSGNQPPKWPFLAMPVRDEEDRKAVGEALRAWCEAKGLDPEHVQWLEVPQ